MLAEKLDILPSHLTAKRISQRIRAQQKQDYYLLELPECFIRYRMAGKGDSTIVFATDAP